MFVDITDFKSALAVENILTPYKKGRLSQDKKTRLPKEKITPDVCMEVLKSTNYARNIKDMLLCIAELPEDEQAPFKDVVLAVFDKREQPNDILVLGKKLAVAHGFEEELNAHLTAEKKETLLSAPKLSRAIYTDAYTLDNGGVELENYDKLVWKQKNMAFLKRVKLPAYVELPETPFVQMENCDLNDCVEIRCPKASQIRFIHLGYKGASERLMVSDDAEVCIDFDEVSLVENWKFNRNKWCVEVVKKHFNDDVDMSKFAKVFFSGCKVAEDVQMTFAPHSSIQIMNMHIFPKNMDFENFQNVNMNDVDLSCFETVKFAKGSTCTITSLKGAPKVLDVSQCAQLKLGQIPQDASHLTIIFQNREQMENAGFYRQQWEGKIVFADGSAYNRADDKSLVTEDDYDRDDDTKAQSVRGIWEKLWGKKGR